MDTYTGPFRAMVNASSSPPELTEMLLNRWLSLSEEGRKQEFVNTARAAGIAGVAQRTIQHWIEERSIAAVPIGRRHQVYLVSLRKYLELRSHSWAVREPRIR